MQGSFPIFADGKFALESVDEVVDVLLSNILDTKILDEKAELDREGDVFPETRSIRELVLYVGGSFSFKYLFVSMPAWGKP